MYEVPSSENVDAIRITEASVLGKEKPMIVRSQETDALPEPKSAEA